MKAVIGREDLESAAVTAGAGDGFAIDVELMKIRPVHNASKQFLDEGTIDICEIAIITLLQAACYDKSAVLFPVTSLGRFQHQTLVTCKGLSLEDLKGRSVGVRSWSQTTGVWMRGFLSEGYGVDLREIDWVVYEDGHVSEYVDPEWVVRAPKGSNLQADFLAGKLDFGIMGLELPSDDRIRSVIPDPDAASAAWSIARGFVPVNHVLSVNERTAHENSALICAIYDAMKKVIQDRRGLGSIDFHPLGFEALRGPFTAAIKFGLEQEVLTKEISYDELVERTCHALGAPASRLS